MKRRLKGNNRRILMRRYSSPRCYYPTDYYAGYLAWLHNMSESKEWRLPLNGNCHKTLQRADGGLKSFNGLRDNRWTARSLQQLLILGLIHRRALSGSPSDYGYYLTFLGRAALKKLESFRAGTLDECRVCSKRSVDCLLKEKCKRLHRFIPVSVQPSSRWLKYFEQKKW